MGMIARLFVPRRSIATPIIQLVMREPYPRARSGALAAGVVCASMRDGRVGGCANRSRQIVGGGETVRPGGCGIASLPIAEAETPVDDRLDDSAAAQCRAMRFQAMGFWAMPCRIERCCPPAAIRAAIVVPAAGCVGPRTG